MVTGHVARITVNYGNRAFRCQPYHPVPPF
jgi:hypothetical protein